MPIVPIKPPVLPGPFAYNGDKNTIPDTGADAGAASWASGFPPVTQLPLTAGGIPPQRNDFNGVLNAYGVLLSFIQTGALFEWSDELTYPFPCFVVGSDNVIYIWVKASGVETEAGAKNPTLEANRAYWIPLESFVSGNFVPNSRKIIAGTGLSGGGTLANDVTVSLASSVNDALNNYDTFRKSWIGIPRPWRSTTLPTGFVWANGGLVLFEDYPELEEVYNANGFSGMVLAYDADEETIAANLGKWRPNAANPTGLYTPSWGGQFSRAWVPGSATAAGMSFAATLASHAHALLTVNIGRDTVHGFTDLDNPAVGIGGPNGSGSQSYVDTTLASDNMPSKALMEEFGGAETVPQHIWTPCVVYLGLTI